MATSSIFADFTIVGAEKAEAFLHALEESEKAVKAYEERNTQKPTAKHITDGNEIRRLLKKYL